MLDIVGDYIKEEQKIEILNSIDKFIRKRNMSVSFYGCQKVTFLNTVFWTAPNPNTNLTQSMLADIAGNEIDNQVVYQVTDKEGRTIYLAFSDSRIGLGAQIQEYVEEDKIEEDFRVKAFWNYK